MNAPHLLTLGLLIGLVTVGIDLAQAYLGRLLVKTEHLTWAALAGLTLITCGMLIWCFTLDGERLIRAIALCVFSAGFCVYALTRLEGHGFKSGKPVMIEVVPVGDDEPDAPKPEKTTPTAPPEPPAPGASRATGAAYIVGDDPSPTEKTKRTHAS